MQLQEKIQTEGKVYVERGEQATEKRRQLQAKLADLREQLRVLEGEEQDCTQTIETSKSELRKISEIFAEEERRLDTTQRQNEAKELEFENKLVRSCWQFLVSLTPHPLVSLSGCHSHFPSQGGRGLSAN